MEKKPSRLRGYLLFQRARIASTFNLILVADNYSLFEFLFFFIDTYDTRCMRYASYSYRTTNSNRCNINVRIKFHIRRNGARSEVIKSSQSPRLKLVK